MISVYIQRSDLGQAGLKVVQHRCQVTAMPGALRNVVMWKVGVDPSARACCVIRLAPVCKSVQVSKMETGGAGGSASRPRGVTEHYIGTQQWIQVRVRACEPGCALGAKRACMPASKLTCERASERMWVRGTGRTTTKQSHERTTHLQMMASWHTCLRWNSWTC